MSVWHRCQAFKKVSYARKGRMRLEEKGCATLRGAGCGLLARWARVALLTMVLLLALAGRGPGVALGEPADISLDEQILEQYRIERSRTLEPLPSIDEPYDESSVPSTLTVQQDLPSSYSSVELGYVTPVKNQNPFETCWAFSSIACVEAFTLRNNVLPGETAETLDLSERHLAYFTYHVPEDPLGYTDGDYVEFVPEGTRLPWDSKNCYLNCASMASVVELALGAYRGVASESVAPYAELLESYDAHEAGDCDFNAFLEETALPDQLSRENVVTITDAETAPMSDVSTVKQWIMERGAVMVDFHYDWNYIKFPNATYYCDEYTSTDHFVTIVGWDDSVPRDDFGNDFSWTEGGQSVSAPNAKPTSDGAWLCKNSWGTGWCPRYELDVRQGDYEVSRPAGYFWVSYEDVNFKLAEATSFQVRRSEERNVYMHDGGVGVYNHYQEGPYQLASLYQVPEKEEGYVERLSSVGFFTVSTDVRCSIQVVRNPIDPTDPSSGEALLEEEQKGWYPCPGFHCVDLPEEVLLEPGDTFAVILTLSHESGGVVGVGADVEWEFDDGIFHCACNLGENFARRAGDDAWTDLAADESYKKTVRIRAYTVDVERREEPGPEPEPEPGTDPAPGPGPEPTSQPIPGTRPEAESAGQRKGAPLPLTDDGALSPCAHVVLALFGGACVGLGLRSHPHSPRRRVRRPY